jgi:hypothetical protein
LRRRSMCARGRANSNSAAEPGYCKDDPLCPKERAFPSRRKSFMQR